MHYGNCTTQKKWNSKFLKIYTLSKLTHEEKENLNRPLTQKDLPLSPSESTSDPECLTTGGLRDSAG